MTYTTDKTAKFLIMNDISKRAVELTKEMAEKGGLTFSAGIVGYRMPRAMWRIAKDAGFEKQADGRWIGFTKSWNGEEGYAEDAYALALKEKREEIGDSSFLDSVSIYYYLT